MRIPQESDLLVPFELENLRGAYRQYVKAKRDNLFQTIFEFPVLWDSFEALDEIWMREFQDIETNVDAVQVFCAFLFMDAHTHFRTALELGFSRLTRQAVNALRTGIESVTHAHKVFREPHLIKVWAERHDKKSEDEAYKNAFVENKEKSLFPEQYGLNELYGYWSDFSEWGAHTNIQALAMRFEHEPNNEGVKWGFRAFETQPKRVALCLFSLLRASHLMERALFGCFEPRFNLDPALVQMREDFDHRRVQVANDMMSRFSIPESSVLL